MNPHLLWSNLVAYSLQVGLLIGVAAAVPRLLRLQPPRGRLLFWRISLAACLLLPVVQPWQQPAIEVVGPVVDAPVPATPLPPAPRRLPLVESALALVALGIALRSGWLALGLLRLRRYRRAALPLHPLPAALADLRALAPDARLCLSAGVASPVTFGARRPVILLPARFPQLELRLQRAIVCHEMLHVARRDWLATIAEEMVRALLWFHPAVWWLLGQLQLSREQTVDREVLDLTRSPHEYLDALLAIAGARPQLDLAPAPLFLRRRHLKQRVVSILEEVPMSTKRMLPRLAAGLGALALAAWLSVSVFPLAAAPQWVADADGVTVDAGAAVVVHRAAVDYPEAARQKGVEGTVTLEVTLAADGTVSDARVLGGPEPLRRAALQSVLQWHFSRGSAASVRTVSIAFQTHPAPPAPTPVAAEAPAARAAKPPSVAHNVEIRGLSKPAEDELRALIPSTEGGTMDQAALLRVQEVVRQFDEHLRVGFGGGNAGNPPRIRIVAPESQDAPQAAAGPATQRLRVGGNAQQAKLIEKTRCLYPPQAKQERIQGVVKLQALLDKEGNVANLDVLSGDPLLAAAAVEAVRQWKYAPTLLNGNPVEVITQVDVNFTLTK